MITTDNVDIAVLNVRMSREYRSYLDSIGAQLGMKKPEVIEAAILMLAKAKDLGPVPSRLGNPIQPFLQSK